MANFLLFFSSHTLFSPDGVHSKTTLFLFVTSLLHTLILHPSSPLPSSPKLALMFSVFNHCSTALFALSHSLFVSSSFPSAVLGARKESCTMLHFASTPTTELGLWESDRQNVLTTALF